MKRVFIVVTALLLLLAACEAKTTGKKVAVSPTGAVATVTEPEPVTPEGDTGTNAKDVLDDFKVQETLESSASGPKTGTSFYPPVVTNATGADALKDKTRALMSSGQGVQTTDSDKEFGSRYYTNDGGLKNLPDNYDDEGDR